jgi:indole-3-glycerol phosphate synthase
MSFVRTETILDAILARKQETVASLRSQASALHRAALEMPPTRNFAASLRQPTIALIAEIKKASPSKGILIDPFDPVGLARLYAENGASALSVLTDEPFFQGHLSDLQAVRAAVNLPLLRKDFIIDPVQIAQARAAGADAILLIVMALDDAALVDLQAAAHALGMAALIEVHSEPECERALKAGATLVGINNRDLRTFREDLSVAERVIGLIPSGVTVVAESAMRTAADVIRMGRSGVHAVLVGEGLLKAPDIATQTRAFASQSRPVHTESTS